MKPWHLITKDMIFISSIKSDINYMIEKEKVLTQRKEFVQIIKPNSKEHNKIKTKKYE
jgi:hypothetical protein